MAESKIKPTGWIYLGSTTGTATISLPENFNELLILFHPGNYDTYFRQAIVPRNILVETDKSFYTGDYQNSTSFFSGSVVVNLTTIKLAMIVDGSQGNITSTSGIIVYYR